VASFNDISKAIIRYKKGIKMALRELRRSTAHVLKKEAPKKETPKKEEKVKKFIAKGGTLAKDFEENKDDHRLTLRIPKFLMDRVDVKRKERIGKISRNLWILEMIEKATRDVK
jgi:hypothetical protein